MTAADEGTRMHLLIAKALPFGDMPPDAADAEVVSRCVDYWHEIVPNGVWSGDTEVEVRVKDAEGRALTRPGHIDALWLGADEAHLFDWKTGQALWTRRASEDYQLAVYALGVHCTFGVDRVTAHRVHPRLTGEYFATTAEFAGPWNSFQAMFRAVVDRAVAADSRAVAGVEQCAYCRAKVACREFQRWAEPPASLAPVSRADLTPARVGDLLAWKDKLKMLNRAFDDLEQYAMRLLDAGQTIPAPGGGEYVVTERPGNRKIESAREVSQVLDTIKAEALFEACNMSVGKLESKFAAIYGVSKAEAARRLEEMLGDLITRGNPVRKLEVMQ